MSTTPEITFTVERREQLRKAYNNAVATRKDAFVWCDVQFHVPYAKYLLEYLDLKLPPVPKEQAS